MSDNGDDRVWATWAAEKREPTFRVGRERHVVIDGLAPGDEEDGDGVVVVAHVVVVDGRDVARRRQVLAFGRGPRPADACRQINWHIYIGEWASRKGRGEREMMSLPSA